MQFKKRLDWLCQQRAIAQIEHNMSQYLRGLPDNGKKYLMHKTVRQQQPSDTFSIQSQCAPPILPVTPMCLYIRLKMSTQIYIAIKPVYLFCLKIYVPPVKIVNTFRKVSSLI